MAVAAAMQHSAINLAGRTSLGAMALLLQEAQLLICNDTGISHLAAALQVPSVVTFLQADAVPRWAPLDQSRHRAVVLSHKHEQNHSRYFTCAVNQGEVVDVTAVLGEARYLLNQEIAYVG
jgi:ADP-heptose:LPS heptosyltransferase